MKKLLCRYVQYVNIFCSIISSTPLPGIPFGEFKQGSLYDVECNGISIVSTSLATFPFSCWFFFFRFFAGCNMHIRSLVTELLRFRDTAVALLWVSLILPYVLFHGCQSHRLLQRLLRLKILLNSIICCNCYNCEFFEPRSISSMYHWLFHVQKRNRLFHHLLLDMVTIIVNGFEVGS